MDHDLPLRVLEDLAEQLWRERHLLELLLLRLVTTRLLLTADEHRFVAVSIDEVDRVATALEQAEAHRVRAVRRVAHCLGAPEGLLTLAELARRAPAPMHHVLDDHRQAFRQLSGEIREAAAQGLERASASLDGVQRSLDALTAGAPTP